MVPTTAQPQAVLQDNATAMWDLVEQAKAGNNEAFARIYKQHREEIFRYVYARTSNLHLAEDLTAETFLRALKKIGTVNWQGTGIVAWLVTIAHNLVIDYFRSGWYRYETPASGMLNEYREEPSPWANPEETTANYMIALALLTAIGQLLPDQRQCLELRFLRGFTLEETAQEMCRKKDAIKSLQHRAIRSLARQLPSWFRETRTVR